MRGSLALIVASIALAGCAPDVKESDAFATREDMTAERRRASEDTRAKIDAAVEASRQAIRDAAGVGPVLTVLSPPTGPMIVPGSSVTLRIEALDMGHGVAMAPAEIAMFVPTPPPWVHSSRIYCAPCMQVMQARGMNFSNANALPSVVIQDMPAFLEPRVFYLMGVGGVYEVPEVHHAIHGYHRRSVPTPPHAPTGDLRVASKPPRLKVTVLSACKADVRRVEIRWMEWDQGWIPLPKGMREDRWNEFHGCR
ncbi:MAG TPA: hypothetical protein VII68_13820 [Casimicrobiaceae bacterium]